ncbi:MAG TPA: dihydrodipicolinate synthase family protein [Methanosarcinales archaeon]|nr:dihydrodipicolinate synthase family protein [Methanosarcinales archaeon]
MSKMLGVIPNIVTPMNVEGRPDLDGVASLSKQLIKEGVGGLWVLGSAGEDIHISLSDRMAVASAAIEAVGDDAPIVVGLSNATYYEIMEFCNNVDVSRAEGVHYLPYDVKMDDVILIDYILKLANDLPCPLWLYHNPKRGKPISFDVVSRVCLHPNIIGIKVGGYSLSNLTSMMMLRSESFEVSGAGGGQMYQMLSLGARLHMTSDASCYPSIFISLLDLFRAGKLEEARKLQFDIIKFTKGIPRTGNGENSAEEKYIINRRYGIIKPYVNSSYRMLRQDEKDLIDKQLMSFNLL